MEVTHLVCHVAAVQNRTQYDDVIDVRSLSPRRDEVLLKRDLTPSLLCSLGRRELVKDFTVIKNRCTLGCSR